MATGLQQQLGWSGQWTGTFRVDFSSSRRLKKEREIEKRNNSWFRKKNQEIIVLIVRGIIALFEVSKVNFVV